MAEYTDSRGIRHFRPDDSETTFYVMEDMGLEELLERIKKKWGDVPAGKIRITAEYLHTDCLGYDLYDAFDWTRYLKIEKRS